MLYGFQAEQIALAISVWGMAFCSSLARSVAIVDKRRSGGRRDGIAARVAFAATSGFAAVVWIGCIGMVAGNEWLPMLADAPDGALVAPLVAAKIGLMPAAIISFTVS